MHALLFRVSHCRHEKKHSDSQNFSPAARRPKLSKLTGRRFHGRQLGWIDNSSRRAPAERQLQEWWREHGCDYHHDYDRREDGIADHSQALSNAREEQPHLSARHHAYTYRQPFEAAASRISADYFPNDGDNRQPRRQIDH